MIKIFFILFSLIICLPGCSKKAFVSEKSKNKIVNLKNNNLIFFDYQDDFILSSIPIPFNILNKKIFKISSIQYLIEYNSAMNSDEFLDWYKEKMNFFGWNFKSSFIINNDLCILFEKPNSKIIINGKKKNKKSFINNIKMFVEIAY